ncbi:hypothetical protein Hanom_Chr01g00093601 [Helianthus anomalus]
MYIQFNEHYKPLDHKIKVTHSKINMLQLLSDSYKSTRIGIYHIQSYDRKPKKIFYYAIVYPKHKRDYPIFGFKDKKHKDDVY